MTDAHRGWLPSTELILRVPAGLEQVIPPDYQDRNGHMNVKHYYELQSTAVWRLFYRLGFARDGKREQGTFSLEQHLRYHNEVMVGHKVSAHVCVLGRTDKLIQGMSFLVNRTTDEVANTLEFMSANVDLAQRRTSPFPPRIADAIDRDMARYPFFDGVTPPGPVRLSESPTAR